MHIFKSVIFSPLAHNDPSIQTGGEATENARHENLAQRKLQVVENAGLENAHKKMQSWKMRDKSVRKAKSR